MAAIVIERVIVCRSSALAMYSRLIDTRRLNRAIGNPHLDAEPYAGEGGARFLIHGKLGGIPVTYEEQPFEWDHGRFFSYFRLLHGGPGRSVASRYEFVDNADSGSVVNVRVEAEPRLAIARPIVWAATTLGVKPLVRYIESVDAELVKGEPPAPPPAQPDMNRLRAAAERLAPRHPREVLHRLIAHLTTGDEIDMAAIRPFELADTWKMDRLTLLRVCLDAVPAGLLELRWTMLCPSCRMSTERITTLSELGTDAHCNACDLRFGVELDRAVEAHFVPHPTVRAVDERPMCVAGPIFMPHILAQAVAPPGGRATLRAPEAGRYRIFARGGGSAALVVSDGAPEVAEVTLEAGALAPAQVDVAPRGAVIVENREADVRHAKIERTEWLFNAATAHDVATLPEFRALFGAEALKPGLALKIARVAVLFSDLCGSTALYSRVGDAAAFGVVSDSFAFGAQIVEGRGGSIVKTMGDAIMAAFVDPESALDAAAELVRGWQAFQERAPLAQHLDIKVGLVVGPCTVVTANGTLDYFGQTVNRAARVQHLAGPRELVVPSALLEDLPIPAGLQLVERFSTSVKGIEEPIALTRLGLAPAADPVER